MNKIISISIVSSFLLSIGAIAEEINTTDVEAKYASKSEIKATKELKQDLNFGFANTSGNTKTLNLNGKYNLSTITEGYDNQDLLLAFDTSLFITKNNGTKDNEEYQANLGLEQFIMDGWLGYASANWLQNKFLNYDNKFSVGAGVGKELYNEGSHSLKAKLGVAYNVQQFTNAQADHKFTSLNEYLEYNNQLNKANNLYVKVGALENFDDFSNDYEAIAVIGFNFALAENFSLSVEEEIRYDNLPPVGFKKTDTKSIVRLGYHF